MPHVGVLLEDFLVLWSPNMKPAWQLSNKAALAAGTAAEAGLRKAKPLGWFGIIQTSKNFGKQRLQIESFGYILEAQTLGFAGVFFNIISSSYIRLIYFEMERKILSTTSNARVGSCFVSGYALNSAAGQS